MTECPRQGDCENLRLDGVYKHGHHDQDEHDGIIAGNKEMRSSGSGCKSERQQQAVARHSQIEDEPQILGFALV